MYKLYGIPTPLCCFSHSIDVTLRQLGNSRTNIIKEMVKVHKNVLSKGKLLSNSGKSQALERAMLIITMPISLCGTSIAHFLASYNQINKVWQWGILTLICRTRS